jgi:hypothetical protein
MRIWYYIIEAFKGSAEIPGDHGDYIARCWVICEEIILVSALKGYTHQMDCYVIDIRAIIQKDSADRSKFQRGFKSNQIQICSPSSGRQSEVCKVH